MAVGVGCMRRRLHQRDRRGHRHRHFLMVTVGVMLGRVIGTIAVKPATIVGAILLIGIGVTIVWSRSASATR